MPFQINADPNGKALLLRVKGKVIKSDFADFELEFNRLVREHGKLRVLFDITDFHGWTADALLEEVRFDLKHYADIERLAVIGDKKWHHGMATLFKPFTMATIRYFDHAKADDGLQWLEAA